MIFRGLRNSMQFHRILEHVVEFHSAGESAECSLIWVTDNVLKDNLSYGAWPYSLALRNSISWHKLHKTGCKKVEFKHEVW